MIFNILVYIFSAFIVLYSIYLAVISIFGLFVKDKNYENVDEENIAVLIPCNNEEKVIVRLLEALNSQTYSKYKVFVVAHNCNDDTANKARSMNCDVIEYNDINKRTKTDALDYGIKYINENYNNEFKYLTIFDGDSIPDENFLKEINNAMAFGSDVASGFIKSANYNSNLISKMCSMLYLMTMNCNSIPNNYFGLPVNYYGSGACFKYELIKNGFNTTTIVEDFEFVTREVLNKRKFIFASKAIFKVEVPVDLKTALRQRRRWAIGDTQCFKKYIKYYFKSIKNLGAIGIKQMVDLCLNPSLLIGSIGILLCIVKIITNRNSVLLLNFMIIELILFCLIYCIASITTLKKEKISIFKNISVILLMPIWFSVSIVYAVESFFIKDTVFEKTIHLGVIDESNI